MGSENSGSIGRKSYASLDGRGLGTLAEFWHLYRHNTENAKSKIASTISTCEEMQQTASEEFDLTLRDLDVLEVGAGQQLLMLKYFSRNNRVTALDYDIVIQGFDPAAYVRVFKENGPKRVIKTALRKLIGIDRAYWNELEKYTGPVQDRLAVVQGDAHAMPWPDDSFDLVYSFSVFEHLRDPAQCLEEVVRVLRPGGLFCIGTHMYTSDSGAHDPRSFLTYHENIAPWAHLRPVHRDSVKPNAYCNGWRNEQWEKLFRDKCEGVKLRNHPSPNLEWLRQQLAEVRSAGELTEYSDEELLTGEILAVWRKPQREK